MGGYLHGCFGYNGIAGSGISIAAGSMMGGDTKERLMENSRIGQHISQQYNVELEDIRNNVLAMGGLVEEQIRDAIKALVSGDSQLGETVITNDFKINALEVHIDEECARILARRQPTTSDLRLIVAVIKTITDLERIGDEAEKVARMAVELAALERPRTNYRETENLGEHVQSMVHKALDAFARLDIDAAISVAAEDKNVDHEYEGILRQLMTHMMEDPRSIKRVMDVIWSIRALERIGDHAKNICEYVIFLVKGKDVRHLGLDEIKKEVIGIQPEEQTE